MDPKPYSLDKISIRMVKEPPLYSSTPVKSPDDAVRLIAEMLQGYDREVFCIVNFKTDLTPINMNIVSMGTLDASLVHPREILKSSILSNAAQVMAFHNHDWEFTMAYEGLPAYYHMIANSEKLKFLLDCG